MSGMNIAIVGFNTEGQATYDFLKQQGHVLTICDRDSNILVPEGAASVLGDSYLDDLDRFDMIIRTAGMPPRVILEKNPEVAHKISTHINEFFKACPTKNIIGVTGTKGKGTTSTLIYKILQAAGKDVQLGGNIGVPPLSFIDKLNAESWVVLELSSFQLIDVQFSPHIAVCLMVVPEHLDWHASMDEYVKAKSQLFAHQTSEDIAIFYSQNDLSRQIAGHSPGQKLPYFTDPGATIDNGSIKIDNQDICRTDELQLLGAHNWQNVCAAVTAVWQVTQDIEAMRTVLKSFTGLPHRLEFVRELDGVQYYDDSFGTTPETAIVAMQSFEQPKVLILGGSDKGASYDELAKAVATGNVRKVLLIGDQAGRIQSALEAVGFTDFIPGGGDMPTIARNAREAAQPGDVVLLSTACASFDMFKHYQDRGEQFSAAVRALV
jgi:UDP-N-acetylmuramoylalanine--D-glutamate ligase